MENFKYIRFIKMIFESFTNYFEGCETDTVIIIR